MRRRRELAEHAKAELLRTLTENRAARDIAGAGGASTFHPCRVFRLHTGRTMHEYRTELRLRMALEHLAAAGAGGTLSGLAYRLGVTRRAYDVPTLPRPRTTAAVRTWGIDT